MEIVGEKLELLPAMGTNSWCLKRVVQNSHDDPHVSFSILPHPEVKPRWTE
jgi:hypothetical protein